MRFLLVSLALLSALAAPAADTADLILRNGKIVTLEKTAPVVQALAVKGGRILAVGSNAIIDRYRGPATRVIDLRGRLAIPGFIEGHGHFAGMGEFRMSLDLREAQQWEEIVGIVARAAARAKPGEWIVGRGWHQSKWRQPPSPQVEGYPVHESLSRVSPHNPVLLAHASGHAAFMNEAAIKAAGIEEAKDPAGGHIVRDKTGRATGALQETAQGLAYRALESWKSARPAEEQRAELRRQLELAASECLANGITSFQDAGSPFELIDELKQMADEGRLPLRLWVMLRASNEELARKLPQYRLIGAGKNTLTVRAIKRAIDGALGSHGAWLLEPYSDLPSDALHPSGLNTADPADIAQTADLARRYGFQLCVHAIGDRANRETLDIFERAGAKGLRWRVEHAQHLHRDDIPRFGQLSVIASMQAIHCTSDAPYVLSRLGSKRAAEGAYVWKKLLRTGAVVTNGTDAPVESVSPLASFHAAVSRRLKDGSVFYPEQRMSREEALRAYTISNAYAAFEEDVKGSLRPGKLADITVLSRDILTIPEDDIPLASVLYTIVGGEVRYENSALTGTSR